MCERKKEKDKKGASPGIEPGPLAPEANIIPLNYEAVQYVCVSVSHVVMWCVCQGKKKKRSDPGGGRTHDLSLRRRMRFHCATGPSKRRGKKSVIRRKVGREGEREEKRGFAGNRTRATRTLSGYFTT